MSDSDEMVRLMRHAASLLATARRAVSTGMNMNTAEREKVTSAVAAMAHGEAILNMVAASVAPEGDAIAQKLIDGFRLQRYDQWADKKSYASLTYAEQAAIRVYLRELIDPEPES